MKKYIIALLTFSLSLGLIAQPSSAILEQMQRFNTFTSVLYLAAHPDDENTRVISWLVNGEHARAGYLSLTRGSGGQNLIGKEFGDALGILRTRELLAARSIDGGEQYFSRAVDFGYSRSAEETLEKWDEEKILADVVWVIRTYKPQLIITRFPPDERAGHGHHTASAMLAIKAFAAAADESQFPEQLKFVNTWKVQSVYWNGSTWWDKTLESDMAKDSAIWRADIGGYNPLTGKSNNELGSLARSQHKCQGFGVDIQRGETFEYFRPLAGEPLYQGLKSLKTPTWADLGVGEVEKMLADVMSSYDQLHPEKSLNQLAAIYKVLNTVKDEFWRNQKQEQCKHLIIACAGLFVEANAANYAFESNGNIAVKVDFLSRLTDKLSIGGLRCNDASVSFKQAAALPKNQFSTFDLNVSAPKEISNPYWLSKPHGDVYSVDDQQLIGKAENDPLLKVHTNLVVNGIGIPITIPVKYKWQDRVEGEQQREIVVTPPFCINFKDPMYVALNNEPLIVEAKIVWFVDSGDFKVNFDAEGWAFDQKEFTFSAKGFAKEEWVSLSISPEKKGVQSKLNAFHSDGSQVRGYTEVAYSHIPTQVYMPLAETNLTNLDVQKVGTKVGYIQGAGDRVAEGIAQMGYEVDFLDENNIANTDLTQYQAIVVGIRAYNTQAWLQNYSQQFFDFVNQGGNFIVQYNTASRFLKDAPLIPAPYTFELGRGRVTEEDAKAEFLLPKNPVFKTPNKITEADFDGWVQERGLYFASEWDEHYKAPIGWKDKGNETEKGGLIIADFGQGAYMYTGISFFRELPAGVPGAYRLLANLISYKSKK